MSDIYTVGLAGGNLRRLTAENKNACCPMWTPDGRSIVFESRRSGLGRTWRISAAGGAIEPETIYPELGSLSRDGTRMVYVEGSGSSSIWRADLSRAGGEVSGLKQTFHAAYTEAATQLSSDGRQIVFASWHTGKLEMWKSNADGGDQVQLTSLGGGHAGSPRWSPDDKWIAFDYRPDSHGQIYLVDAEGRNLRQVTSGSYDNVVPIWSRDGKSIYFSSTRTGDDQIWRRVLATGQETQVTRHGGLAAIESFDAKTLYYSKRDGGGIWSIPVDRGPAVGGEEQHITEALHRGYWGYFAVTDSGLYFVDTEAKPGPAIMFYDFRTRQVTPVLTLKYVVPWSPSFAASRDGRTVLFSQAESKSSLIMVEYLQ